jgi:uncharacterized membrane protein YphA (DoxX/SURF4 family)
MAEIAILQRIREDRERERRARGFARWGACERTALLCGRAIFGGFFLYNGINHFLNREMMTGYSASKGVPYPEAAVTGSGAMLVLGGLSVLMGVRPKLGTSLISAFLLGVTPKMHDFWNVQDPQQRMGEQINFSKNVALLGGALIAAGVPEPWPASVALAR